MNEAYQGDRRPCGELEGLVQCDGIQFFGTGDTDLHRALGSRLRVGCVFLVDLLG
jgi:hypothetical protein